MAYYLLQGTYTSDAWKALVRKPEDRIEVVRIAIEKLGGRIDGAWFAFGDYDLIVVMQLPDNMTAAAFSLAVAAGGAFKANKTTPLMTIAEGIQAMKKAASVDYRPPAS